MESSFNVSQQQSSDLTPLQAAAHDELGGSSENGGSTPPEGGANKRSRIWAACETCRSRKARCDGEQPCSACEKRARSGFPKDEPVDAEAVLARAREICVFDWNRKPRGPKAKARDPAAPTARSKRVKLAEKGAPRSEKSAGSAYVAAQGAPKSRGAMSAAGGSKMVSNSGGKGGYEDAKNAGMPAYGEAGGSNWQNRTADASGYEASHAPLGEIRLSSAGSSKPPSNSLPRLTWVSGPAADEISDPRDALASLRGSISSDGDLVTPWPMPAGYTHNLQEANRQLATRQEAQLQGLQLPRAPSACVLDGLMENLQNHYAADDWFLIALSVAQWSDFDVAYKACPARYIFGQVDPHDPAPPTPAHVQLALLALLANRALLFPTQYSDRELAFAHPEAPAELARWGGRLSSGKFAAPLRERLREFSRRSSSMANSIMLNLVAEGHVDPTVLHTGYLISWLSSEDGMSSSDVHDMRAWLFHIIRAWKLYLLDVPADVDVSELNSIDDPPGAPQARRCDARYLLQDPIEREGIRRVIIFIRAAYLWSRTAENAVPVPSSFYHLDIAAPMEDDFIHLGAAWNPPANTGSNVVIRVLHMSSLTAGRVTQMLNTPLEDLFNGRGPEPDLQRAIDEIEATLDTARALTPTPMLDGSDFPCLISGFLNLRVVDFLCYRLFLTLTLYQNFTINSPQNQATTSMRAGTWISPAPETVSFHEALIPPTSADALAESPWPAQATLRFSRNPSLASLQPLFDVDDVVSTTLELLDRQLAAERASGPAAMGAQPQAALTSVTRGMRLPLHLQRLCAGACAMAAEMDASLDSWGAIFSSMQSDAQWALPDRGSRVPPLAHPQRCSKALWGIGERLVRLIYALARDGNEYARNVAVKAEMYHTERMAWVAIRQQAHLDNAAAAVAAAAAAGPPASVSSHTGQSDDDHLADSLI